MDTYQTYLSDSIARPWHGAVTRTFSIYFSFSAREFFLYSSFEFEHNTSCFKAIKTHGPKANFYLYVFHFGFFLSRFVTRNLEEFNESINQSSKPMFQVDAILSAPEIVMKPTETEVYNIVIHSVKDFLER